MDFSLILQSAPTVQTVMDMTKGLLVDLGVWSWLGAAMSFTFLLIAVSMVFGIFKR